MRQRIITGLLFGIVVLALLLFHDFGRILLLVLIPILCFIEYASITKFKILDYLLLFALTTIAITVCFQFENYQNYFLWLSIGINLLLLVNLFTDPPFIKHKSIKILIAWGYLILPFVLAYFNLLHSTFSYLLIASFLLIWVADSCAYFVGSRVGKRKLFPRISPGKTWEGFLGAGMCSMLASYILFSVYSQSDLHAWFVLALLVWGLGMFGDLIASHVKRLFQIKDSGNLLPGHGGFYDRFDALVFILPFVILIEQLIFKT